MSNDNLISELQTLLSKYSSEKIQKNKSEKYTYYPLKIEISGPPGSRKRTVLKLIAHMLKQHPEQFEILNFSDNIEDFQNLKTNTKYLKINYIDGPIIF